MSSHHLLDSLLTRVIDGDCTADERDGVMNHLRECPSCRQRYERESSAAHVLRAHASTARATGIEPVWRPRVRRLGRPMLPVSAPTLAVAAVATIFGVALWTRPASASIVGVVADSYCGHMHRWADDTEEGQRACTLRCVAGGARFVLVTDDRIYQIDNQDLPALGALAAAPVRLSGTMRGDRLTVSTITVERASGSTASSALRTGAPHAHPPAAHGAARPTDLRLPPVEPGQSPS
jgi:anti-sigma factor RsiW